MDAEMISDFLPIIYDYVDSESGERIANLLEDVFPNEF